MQPIALRGTKRARVSRAVLLPLLVVVALLASAVAAQGLPVQAAAGRHLLAPTASRPSVAWHRGIGSLFSPGTQHAGPMAATGPFAGWSGFGSGLVGSAPVGNGPSELALDPATHTIYVANGNNANGPNAGGNTVSVIDDRHCQAMDVSRCQGPWPTITVGNLPSTIAIDQKTDTVYVTDAGDNAVSVFNGATCDALVTSGCGQTPAKVPVGLAPLGMFADPVNHTVYISNSDNGQGGSTTVSMLDSATCNATDLAGCPALPPPTVDVGADPNNIDVNQATHTVYVTTIGANAAQNGWAVFNANTCNATVQSGCGAIGRITGDPAGPNAGEVDAANDTLYTANYDNTVSAFDLRHCDASDLAGCTSLTSGTVTPFPDPPFGEHDLWVAVDVPLHSVYVAYQKDDALIVVDTNVCNGSGLSACASLRPPAIHTGADPESVILDQQTQTLYTANEVDNDVSVIDPSRCNAQVTAGCRRLPPAVTVPGPGGLAADPAVHTVYVASGSSTVSMIGTSGCNAYHPSGCAATPPTVTVGENPSAVAVDSKTHTVYVANFGTGNADSSGSISVVNASTCNATDSAGCANVRTLELPSGNGLAVAVDPVNDTVYVTTAPTRGPTSGPGTVWVFDGATCNAIDSAGCAQVPHSVTVGFFAQALAVDAVTDTVYVTSFADSTGDLFGGNTVSVIDGATCNATTSTGCANAPQTITLGPAFTTPAAVAVEEATDTIYVADLEDGEGPGMVSVINGATCNGSNSSGCGQTPASAAAGFGSTGVAIDLAADTVYVANDEDASVSVIDGATCNGSDPSGCSRISPKLAVGDYADAIAIDPDVGTAYVASSTENTVSVIPLSH